MFFIITTAPFPANNDGLLPYTLAGYRVRGQHTFGSDA